MSEQNKIDEIKEALAAATPGLWHVQPGEYYDAVYSSQETKLTVVINRAMPPDARFIAKAPEYITYLLQEIERKDEATRKAITIWETATPEDDFDDIMHAVIDELKDSLAL
jgi:hypothetical protein